MHKREHDEWMRYYRELERGGAAEAAAPYAQAVTCTAGGDLALTNWCAVQRIARRCGELAADRVALLDRLDFDWAGADPLS